jgi:hypothetical protein
MNAGKKYFPILYLFIANALWMSSSYAADCELSGVRFANLNNDQVLVLQKSGASCSSKNEKNSASDFTLGDLGFVMLDGKKVSYLDLASEDAIKLSGKEVEIYGYTNYFSESDPFKVWGYRFDFEMYEGEFLKNIKTMTSTDPKITIVAAPSQLNKYPEPLTETLASMRKAVFKAVTQAKGGKALIRVRGFVKAFSNTGAMYISTESVELLAK